MSCTDQFADVKVYSITITNNSPDIINYFYQNSYPDTSLPFEKPMLNGVRAGNVSFLDNKREWEEIFSEAPHDTLSFFILSVDTLTAYPWDTIRSQYKILKRYDLSIENLQRNNYTIIYP